MFQALLALFGIAMVAFPKQAGASFTSATNSVREIFGPAVPSNFWNAALVKKAAGELAAQFGLYNDPEMIAAMAKIESGFNPKAQRYEIHLNDSSYGLMQTMLKTAQWLYDLGYKGYARPTAASLKDGRTSIYFGMAYVTYLSKYKNVPRSESFIVESYNGGPGNSNSGTKQHLAKYIAAKIIVEVA